MPQGKIKSIHDEKGFGFISTPGEDDIFFHRTNVESPRFVDLKKGDTVSYERTSSPKGPRAESVRKV